MKNKVSNLLQVFIENVCGTPLNKRLSLQEIAESFSEEVTYIIVSRQEEGNRFAKGTITIEAINGMAFKPEITLYFVKAEDENQGFVMKSESTIQTMSRLTVEAINELNAEQKVSFEINAS